MPNGIEITKTNLKEMEQQAADRARDRVGSLRWDISVAIIAYALLGALVLMRLEGVAIEIVASIAVFGLALVWFSGWRRGRQLFKNFFYEELRRLQDSPEAEKAGPSMPSPLTARELEILNCVALGRTNKEIAYKLHIGEQTVKNHVSSILSKIDASDRTQAVVIAMHYGWISSQVREMSDPDTDD